MVAVGNYFVRVAGTDFDLVVGSCLELVVDYWFVVAVGNYFVQVAGTDFDLVVGSYFELVVDNPLDLVAVDEADFVVEN